MERKDYKSEYEIQRRIVKALGDYVANSESTLPACKFCRSADVVKNGHRKGRQYWVCKHCGKGFVDNKAIPGMRYPTETIGSALWQYYTGSSLNDIRGYIEQHSDNHPSDSTVFNWVKRFSDIAISEADKCTPNVGDNWVADETMVKIGGKNWWLWDIIDEKTRFLLATHLSETRTIEDAKSLMRQAYEKADKAPKRIYTDRLAAYLDGIELTFGAETEHTQGSPFDIENNTNLIERFHGTLKERLKVMRGLKAPETADLAIKGWLVFYNYFRPHESLDNQTPASVAGIVFPYRNWLEVAKSEEPNLELPSGVSTPYRVRKPKMRSVSNRGIRRTRESMPTTMGWIR